MNILIINNSFLNYSHNEHVLAYGLAELGYKVTLVWDSSKILYNWGSVKEHKNLYLIDHKMENLDYSELNDLAVDVCIGLDKSVVDIVSTIKKQKKCLGMCCFNDYPVHVIDGKEPAHYNFDYSQKFYYWINCALDLDKIIFNSEICREEFYKRYHKDSCVIYPTINIDNYLSDNKNDSNSICGCYNIYYAKGLSYLLRSIRTTPFVYKHIYSANDPREFQKVKVLANSINNSVVFYPNVSERDKMKIIYDSFALIYPQIVKWIGSVSVVEAMSVKTPVICFDYPILKEYCEDSVIYVDTKNIVSLRNAIIECKNKINVEDVVSKAYDIYLRKFSNEAYIKSFKEILK